MTRRLLVLLWVFLSVGSPAAALDAVVQCCEFGSFTVGDNALDPNLDSRALQLPTLQRWWFGSETTKTGGIAVVGALATDDASSGFGFQLRQTPGEARTEIW